MRQRRPQQAATLLLLLLAAAEAAQPQPQAKDGRQPDTSYTWAQPRGRSLRLGRSWLQLHQALVQEVEDWDAASGAGVLFLGDSIFESWRGSFLGMSWSAFTDVPALFQRVFGPYNATALAIAGDKSSHLMWRLLNGELPTKHPPKVVVLHIGTNDLAGTACSGSTGPGPAAAVQQIVELLLQRFPTTQVVLLGLLPKGSAWPNSCTPAQKHTNTLLKDYTEATPRVHWVDAGKAFLLTDKSGHQEINPMLLPDSLHPSLKGMQIIAEALLPVVQRAFEEAGGTLASKSSASGKPAATATFVQDEVYEDEACAEPPCPA